MTKRLEDLSPLKSDSLSQVLDALETPLQTLNQPSRFQRTYRNDREAFVHDCFYWPRGQSPKAHQLEALAALDSHGRVCIRSPNGGGKTAWAGWVIFHGILCWDHAKIPTTAGSWLQLTEYLWPEIHKWAPRLRWDIIDHRPPLTQTELLKLAIKVSATCRAFAAGADNPDFIEGAHAGFMADAGFELDFKDQGLIGYVFDEAKAVPEAIWGAAEGAFSGAGEETGIDAFAAAISTPRGPAGEFYKIHARRPGYEAWLPIHWKIEMLIECGMVSESWVQMMIDRYGENHPLVQNRVFGNFAQDDEYSLIPLNWVEAANDRWRKWDSDGRSMPMVIPALDVDNSQGEEPKPFPVKPFIGVDTGYGGDKSIMLRRRAWLVDEIIKMNVRDTMAVCGRTSGMLGPDGVARVDIIGFGAGVYDRLRELKEEGKIAQRPEAVVFGAASKRVDTTGEIGFADVRSACWYAMREWLDPELGSEAALPPDDELTADLATPRWKFTSSGKIKVEAKEQLFKRLGRSPDTGDALACTFAEPERGNPRIFVLG